MNPEEIKSKIIERKKKIKDIAKIANVSSAAVSQVISRRQTSKNIQNVIAEVLEMDFEQIWGKIA